MSLMTFTLHNITRFALVWVARAVKIYHYDCASLCPARIAYFGRCVLLRVVNILYAGAKDGG